MYKYNETYNIGQLIDKIGYEPREVLIDTVSCMCDNMHKLSLKKNSEGDFKLSGGSRSLNNWQMEFDFKVNIEWAADDNQWIEVFRIINTGTSKACNVRSR